MSEYMIELRFLQRQLERARAATQFDERFATYGGKSTGNDARDAEIRRRADYADAVQKFVRDELNAHIAAGSEEVQWQVYLEGIDRQIRETRPWNGRRQFSQFFEKSEADRMERLATILESRGYTVERRMYGSMTQLFVLWS